MGRAHLDLLTARSFQPIGDEWMSGSMLGVVNESTCEGVTRKVECVSRQHLRGLSAFQISHRLDAWVSNLHRSGKDQSTIPGCPLRERERRWSDIHLPVADQDITVGAVDLQALVARDRSPVRVQKVAVAKAAKTNDAYSPNGSPPAAAATAPAPAAAPATAPKAATNGYIAVLSSQSSAVDARKTLDDLQSKFGEILGGKPTDITEFANPRDGKTYYRAIVGPPASKEAALSICTQMTAAGYKGCFATPY